jgi:galactitol PTS system EIIB component
MNKRKSSKKKILCSCGSGVASSSFISAEIRKILEENNIDAEIIECKVSDIESLYKDADLIICTAQLPPSIDRPIICGIPFLTGNNLEETKKKILEILSR